MFYTLLSRPDCFDAYIAASPSVFFAEELLEKTERFFASHPKLDKFLFVPYFEGDLNTTTQVWPQIDRIIREACPQGFRYQVKICPGRGHVPPTALFDGLMALFADWTPVRAPEIFPGGGLLPPGKSFSVELKGFDAEVRYTLDGTEPTRESPLYGGPLAVSRPLTLKAKSFRGRLGESGVASAEYRFGPGPAAREKGRGWEPGLNCRYYERRWFILPDDIGVEPSRTGIAKTFDLSSRTREDGFLFQFDGFLHIPVAGAYRFYLRSTAPGKFFLGGEKVIDNPGRNVGGDPVHEGEECSCELCLDPGYYPVKALYSNCWQPGQTFQIGYEGPGLPRQGIPPGALYRERSEVAGQAEPTIDPRLWQRAREIARRIAIVDCHSHSLFDREPAGGGTPRQVTFPMLEKSGVKGICYFCTGKGSDAGEPVSENLLRDIRSVKAVLADGSLPASLMRNSRDFQACLDSRRTAILIGLESFQGLAEGRLEALPRYYEEGVRAIGLHPSGRDKIFDGEALTPYGRDFIRELNRLGLICDATHLNGARQRLVIEQAQAPVMVSHSAARNLVDSGFNVEDATLEKLRRNGGILCLTFFSGQLSKESFGQLKNAVDWKKITRARVAELVDHVDFLKGKIGIDRIGIGSDYGGSGKVAPEGLETIEGMPLVIYHLLGRGYTENDIAKVMGLNFIRYWERVEQAATQEP